MSYKYEQKQQGHINEFTSKLKVEAPGTVMQLVSHAEITARAQTSFELHITLFFNKKVLFSRRG